MELVDMRDLGGVALVKGDAQVAEYRLPKDFFKNNPLEQYSAPQVFLETLAIDDDEELLRELEKRVAPIAGNIELRNESQRRLIEETDDPAALVDLMRKGINISNTSAYIKKVLMYQGECLPLLLKRYMTSGQDEFIEMSTKVLIKADELYVRQLQEMYERIRNPYARACACLVFGQRGMKDRLQFLVGEYDKFKRQYPGERFEQFPLVAIYQLSGKTVS